MHLQTIFCVDVYVDVYKKIIKNPMENAFADLSVHDFLQKNRYNFK
jgi:hypothetical protein